jgi:ATP-binding protein involved in chromosome partitioning
MSKLTPEIVKKSLEHVIDRDAGVDVVSAGMISGIVIREGDVGAKVGFVITIDPKDKDSKAYLRQACEAQVSGLPGVESVTAVLTAQNSEPIPPKPEAGYAQARERAVWNVTPVEGVKKVIAIASGKGGVGKSTTAVNLGLALVKKGLRVGLLDADIYGPSLPRMLGLMEHTKQPPAIVEGKMVPPQNYGIQCMSMGFVTGAEAAILRGPMISKTLHQLLRFTRWDNLDVLLVDMPPGTGDIHLSMVQQVPLAGAVIVTTPQEVAVMDAQKSLKMFEKTGVAVLGVVENMSFYTDSNGVRINLFGEGGGKRLASDMKVPFLGDIPIDSSIGVAGDQGQSYQGICAQSYETIAGKLL